MADEIKSLNIGGDPVTIAAASVWVEGSMPPDGELLRQIASPGCYINVDQPELLTEFLVQVGSSAAMTPQDVARIAGPLDRPTHIAPALAGPSRYWSEDEDDDDGYESPAHGGGHSRTVIVHENNAPATGSFGFGD